MTDSHLHSSFYWAEFSERQQKICKMLKIANMYPVEQLHPYMGVFFVFVFRKTKAV